jgi:hypothetical protein
MRFLSAGWLALLLFGFGIIETGAMEARAQNETHALASVPQSDEDAGDKEATEANKPSPATNGSAAATQDNRPLLPVRPQGFDPMAPSPMSSDAPPPSIAAERALMGSPALAGVGMMQQSRYNAQIALYLRMLAAASIIALFFYFAQILYLRSSVVETRRSISALVASTEIARQNIDVVKQTSEKELRAYVFTNGAKGEMMNDKSGRYSVRVEVRNFGLTPAYGLSGWMTVFVDDFASEREILSLPHGSEMVETVLPPGGVCFYHAYTHQPITRELKAIAGSARAIYAYGEIHYRDIFGVERFARFRIKCAGERNLNTGSFDHCLGGNDAN